MYHIAILEVFLTDDRLSLCHEKDSRISFRNREIEYSSSIESYIIELHWRKSFGYSLDFSPVSSDNPYSSSFEWYFWDIFFSECLISWRSHFVYLRKVHPELYSMLDTSCTREFFCHEFVVEEPTSCCHPLDFTGTYSPSISCSISMF